MDKQQAYYKLWSSFGIPAYDENSVPDDASLPYITYQVITDSIEKPVFPTASLWYRSNSWTNIDLKLNEITNYIEDLQPIEIDTGYMYVTKGQPWSQRMTDPMERDVKRYILNLAIEFLTKY